MDAARVSPSLLLAGTVDGCYAYAAEPKHSHFKGGIGVSSAILHSYVFSWAPLLVGDTAEVMFESLSRTVTCTGEL